MWSIPVIVTLGAAAFVAANVLQPRRPAGLVAFSAGPAVHVGADETWSPALEVGAVVEPAVVADHGLDVEAQTILADFEGLIESWRTDPPWLTAWRVTVDDAYAGAGLDTAPHHRWRWGALEVPTGEYPLIPVPGGEQ